MIQAKNPVAGTPPLKRKKVLFVITKSNFGGAQRYVYDLATHLPAEFEPVVICGKGGKDSEVGLLAEKLKESGVRTIFLPELVRNIGFSDFSAFRTLLREIRKERPDVLHLNSSKAAGLGAIAGRILKVPHVIFTAHGWPFWEDRSIFAKAGIFMLSWLTVFFAHRTICVSGFDRAGMAQSPFTRGKLVVIRNGIDTYHLKNKESARTELFSAEETGTHENDLWVLTSAELTENKNLFGGVDAIGTYNSKSVRKIFWALMGQGELRESLETYAKSKGTMNQMRFLDFVADGRIFYQAFDAFFLPSKKEGLPYVLLEAGLARLPVAATRVGGIPELIGSGTEGALADPNDTEALSEVLKLALEHPEWGSALHEKVLRDYGMEPPQPITLALRP